MNTTQANDLFSYSINYTKLNELSVKDARDKFLYYQKEGVIKNNCTFDNNIWYTTNEYENIGFHFDFNMFSYRQYADVFKVDLPDFIGYVKTFIISNFGKYVLSGMNQFLRDMRKLTNYNLNDVLNFSDNIKLYIPAVDNDFFSLLAIDEENDILEQLIDAMDIYAEMLVLNANKSDNQRTLADMDTYFAFGDIIIDYWSKDKPVEEWIFYFPLYLWWVLTGVIALRPREFLLLERNCLSYTDNSYYIRLRRNQLKGNRDHITYKIEDDYFTTTYKIPDSIGKEIEKYIELTKDYENTEINTLFVTDVHYQKWGQKKHSNSRFLSYVNMNTILRYFYMEIIQKKYHYHVIYAPDKNSHLESGEIGFIHLGDTRHIALINLMQEGGTPVIAMLLAGHTNVNMSYHYYSNITQFIECKTFKQYQKLTSDTPNFKVSIFKPLLSTETGVPIGNKGYCYSTKIADGNFDDCISSVNSEGEIGCCEECTYFRKTDYSFYKDDTIYKKHIEDDCKALTNAIEIVRAEKGSIESIGEALLKLKTDSATFEQYLLEKRQKGEE